MAAIGELDAEPPLVEGLHRLDEIHINDVAAVHALETIRVETALEENAWALVLNCETGQWGTQHDVTLDIATVPLEWERVEEAVDRLTIELLGADDRGELRILWGRDRLSVVFELD